MVPVCNEAENVEPLVREIHAALGTRAYEMMFVDDGSTDDTAAILRAAQAGVPGAACAATFLPQRPERRRGQWRARRARRLDRDARW